MWPIQLEILYWYPTLFYFFNFNYWIQHHNFFCFKKGNISRTVLRTLSKMFDKVLMRVAYLTTCFKLEEITWRLTEHEDTGLRLGACGRSNLIDKTLIKNLNATMFNAKPITYSESTSKIMARLRWTVFEISLMLAWDFVEECLTISLFTEWLKMY